MPPRILRTPLFSQNIFINYETRVIDEDNEELTIALGEDDEFLGEVMDRSPITSPYEEAGEKTLT